MKNFIIISIMSINFIAKIKGNQGVLHVIKTNDDVDWLINKGEHAPYIPLLDGSMFKR